MLDAGETIHDFEMRDEQSLRDVYWQTQRDDIAIDVGCGWGGYTVPALKRGTTVYAVDSNRGWLQGLINEAGDNTGFHPIHVALSDGEPYPAELCYQIHLGNPDMLPGHVEWWTLDEIVESHQISRVDWLKIDVEGGELAVLRGSLETLKKFHPKLVIEDHSLVYPYVAEYGHSDQIRYLLTELGYDCKLIPYEGSGPRREYFVCS